jgi:hypothetical protein
MNNAAELIQFTSRHNQFLNVLCASVERASIALSAHYYTQI